MWLELRGGTVAYVQVGSDQGNPFTLANPWGTSPVKVVDGRGQPVAHTENGGNVSLPTVAGQTYRITL